MACDITKLKTLKSGTSFMLSSEEGAEGLMPVQADSSCGIYRNDMRLVRAFAVSAVENNAAQLQTDTAFYDGNLYQRIEIARPSAQQEPVKLRIHFVPGCDDIFDVRNADILTLSYADKPYRGEVTEFLQNEKGMSVAACGEATNTEYKTGFSSSLDGVWQNGVFELDVPPECDALYIVGGDENTRLAGDPAARYDEALKRAAQDKQKLQNYGPHFESDDALTNAALRQAQEDLSVMITELETGPYPYAGLPWFSCPFGRDALITTLLLIDTHPALAKGVLAFQAEKQATENDPFRQAEPGKIFHEIRFGEASVAGENPFECYYGGVDTTPLFVMVAHDYFNRTNDRAFIESIWPNIERALDWVENNMADHDGFLRYNYDENGLTQQCWKDSADSVFSMDDWQTIAQDPIAACEVQAYAYEALKAGETFAHMLGQEEKAAHYAAQAQALHYRFNEAFWMEEQNCYAMALDGNNEQCAVISSNAGHCLLTGIVSEERAAKVANRLMKDDSFSGYGIRTLAKGWGYDPLSYHRGSVWPHDTAMVARGMRKHGFDDFSRQLADGLLGAYKHLGGLPELFSGDGRAETPGNGPRPYPSACLTQSWAAAAATSLLANRAPALKAAPEHATQEQSYHP